MSVSGDRAGDAGTGAILPVPALFVRRVADAALAGVAAGAGAEARLDDAERRDRATWQDALDDALVPLPLRRRTVFLSAREAVGAASPHSPLVTCRARAQRGPGWIALIDRSRGRARLVAEDGRERWIGAVDLAAHLGQADPDAPTAWVVAEPTLTGAAALTGAGAPAGTRASTARAKGEQEPYDRRLPPLSRLYELVRPDRSDLWTVVLYAIVIGALTLATPVAVQQLVNTVAFGGLIQPVVILALLLFGGLAFSALLTALQAYVAEQLQRRVFVRVTMDVAERLPRVRIGAFDRQHGPELVNRIFDVFTVQKEGAALLLDGTTVVLQTVVGLLVLSFYHPLMLAFSVVLIASIAFVVGVLGRRAVPTAIAESSAKYAVAGWLEELARHPVAFHNAGGREFAIARADELATRYVTTRHSHFRIVLRQLSGALGLQVLGSSAILGLGGALVVGGQLTLGQLVASELIVTAIVAAVARLGKHLESIYDLLAGVDKLGMLFDLPLEEETGTAEPRSQGPASLALHGIRFGYEHRAILRDVTLRVESGERVGLVGPTGSGKSTLMDLVLGLRRPDAGYVTIDDTDIRLLRLDALREHVACVGEAEIFTGTVLENVRMSRMHVSPAEVDEALARVGIADAIRALPDGLYTPLATDGWPLSPGQVACLMLARAVVTRPSLLLLDEALAPIEDPLRSKVLDGIFDPDAPWTVLAATDRGDVLSRCDRVVEIDDGRIHDGRIHAFPG